MKSIVKIIKIALCVILIPLIVGYAATIKDYLVQLNLTNTGVRAFSIGIIIGVIVWIIFFRRPNFFTTFEHEFCHLVVGLAFLKKPRLFMASEKRGGVVQLYGDNFLISLAPYFLPIFSYLILPFYFLIESRFKVYFLMVLGITAIYHLLSNIFNQFSYTQSDIKASGRVFSTIFLLFANLITYGVLLYFVRYGGAGILDYLRSGTKESIVLLTILLGK